MWDSLNSSSRKDNYDVDNIQLGKDSDRQSGDDSNGEDRDDLATYGYMPSSFGRGRGRGLGRDSGRNSGRGRGLERDVKGKDWDCPSCSNTNWSWRSACNKCGTGKPIVYAVSILFDSVFSLQQPLNVFLPSTSHHYMTIYLLICYYA